MKKIRQSRVTVQQCVAEDGISTHECTSLFKIRYVINDWR